MLAELARDADVIGVVVRNGVVLHAPGKLDLGRSTRLANRAQRRALQALYSTCSIPGCSTSYDRCKLHHVTWWRNGGRTDLCNLLPVCAVHHSKIHNSDWIVQLGPNRELTLQLPDGTIRTTGPPQPTSRRLTQPPGSGPEPPARHADAIRLPSPALPCPVLCSPALPASRGRPLRDVLAVHPACCRAHRPGTRRSARRTDQQPDRMSTRVCLPLPPASRPHPDTTCESPPIEIMHDRMRR